MLVSAKHCDAFWKEVGFLLPRRVKILHLFSFFLESWDSFPLTLVFLALSFISSSEESGVFGRVYAWGLPVSLGLVCGFPFPWRGLRDLIKVIICQKTVTCICTFSWREDPQTSFGSYPQLNGTGTTGWANGVGRGIGWHWRQSVVLHFDLAFAVYDVFYQWPYLLFITAVWGCYIVPFCR